MTTNFDMLAAPDASVRLRGALAVGTAGDVTAAPALLRRCAVEPDFYVRDMLTWALTRLPVEATLPCVIAELSSPIAQARSQALHTLSKIGDARAWPDVVAMIHDDDDEIARSAWRAVVVLVPDGERADLAVELIAELGRGDVDTQRSLSRALVALGDDVVPLLEALGDNDHAAATMALYRDPDSAFSVSTTIAKKAYLADR